MAVSVSNLTSGADIDGGSSSTTASISPASNNLVLLQVNTRTNVSVDPNTPTASGNGLTWVVVGDVLYDSTSASRRRVTLFRAMGASPSSGSVTIDFGGQAQTDTQWTIDQASGVDTSGTNGSGAIVQSATNLSASATTFTVTLGSFSDANNSTYGALSYDGDTTEPTVGSGFTKLATQFGAGSGGGNNIAMISEWKSSNDTTVDATASAASQWGGVAIEIKAATAGGGTVAKGFMTTNTRFWGA